MITSTAIAGYIALFFGLGIVFLGVNLFVGKLIRPNAPSQEKQEVYECGEPTIGSSFVQFDLRFYVVALLFIIFDVEVAFFFPWATVFGKASNLSDPQLAVVVEHAGTLQYTPAAKGILTELGFTKDQTPIVSLTPVQQEQLTVALGSTPTKLQEAEATLRTSAHKMAVLSMYDILVFFAVLMVGFAYVWRRGDLDWVRAVSQERALDRERVTTISRQRGARSIMEIDPLLSS